MLLLPRHLGRLRDFWKPGVMTRVENGYRRVRRPPLKYPLAVCPLAYKQIGLHRVLEVEIAVELLGRFLVRETVGEMQRAERRINFVRRRNARRDRSGDLVLRARGVVVSPVPACPKHLRRCF
jgi:hypothetical protein